MVLVDIPVPGEVGKENLSLHREAWSYVSSGNLLPYLRTRQKYKKSILSLIKRKRFPPHWLSSFPQVV